MRSHTLPRIRTALTIALGISLFIGVPAAGQDETSEPASILEYVPEEIAGIPVEAMTIQGQQHIDGVAGQDPPSADDIEQIQAVVDAAGVTVDDMTTVAWSVADEETGGFLIVFGFQLKGADEATVPEAMLPVFTADMSETTEIEEVQVGDRSVTRYRETAEEDDDFDIFGASDMYTYSAGDTFWMLLGDQELVESTLEMLP